MIFLPLHSSFGLTFNNSYITGNFYDDVFTVRLRLYSEVSTLYSRIIDENYRL